MEQSKCLFRVKIPTMMNTITLADKKFSFDRAGELLKMAKEQECFQFASGSFSCVREFSFVYITSGKTKCLVTPGELLTALNGINQENV